VSTFRNQYLGPQPKREEDCKTSKAFQKLSFSFTSLKRTIRTKSGGKRIIEGLFPVYKKKSCGGKASRPNVAATVDSNPSRQVDDSRRPQWRACAGIPRSNENGPRW
jgi:hypothetical protein